MVWTMLEACQQGITSLRRVQSRSAGKISSVAGPRAAQGHQITNPLQKTCPALEVLLLPQSWTVRCVGLVSSGP